VLTSFCARLYGRRPAGNRALKAVGCAQRDIGPQAVPGTGRWHPDEGWAEIKLPVPLAHLANRPHGRYRLSCPVAFPLPG
jgi:hypothetical protein